MASHLKIRIAVTVSLSLLSFLSLTVWLAFTYFEREFHATVIGRLEAVLATTADDVDAHLQQAAETLAALERELAGTTAAPPGLPRPFADLAAARLTFDAGLMLLTPEGRLLAGDRVEAEDAAAVGTALAATVAARRPLLSGPVVSPRLSGHPVIILTHPVRDGTGAVAAVLAGRIDLLGDNLLARLLARPGMAGGMQALLDRSGNVITCPEHRLVMAPGRDLLPDDLLRAMATDAAGVVEQAEVRGTPMLAGFRRLQGAPWTLAGFYPEADVDRPIRRAYLYALATLVLLSGASILTVRHLSGRLTAPLVTLTGEVRRQLEPDAPFAPPAPGHFAELGELSEAIRTLMGALATRRRELKDQLLFLQNLIDAIPGPIFYKDAAFRYLGCNRTFEEYIGQSREQLIGKTVFDIAPPELAQVYQRADQELWDAGGEQTYEASVRYADGSVHEVVFYKSVFHDAAGQPAGILGVFLDITARKRAEQALQLALAEARAAREQVDNILRSAADGLVVTDRRKRVTHINRIALELLGVTADDVVGRSYARLFRHPQIRSQARGFFAGRNAGARQHEFPLSAGDGGEPVVLQARATPLLDEAGKPAGLVTLLRDVSRERAFDRLRNEFISTAAHEMRTPMSVIMGYAELLIDQERFGTFDDGQRREFLQEIYRKAEALSRLVDDLFDISRIEAGIPLTIDRATCDLNGVVGEVVQRFAERSPRHAFTLALETIPQVSVDADKLSQVFDNLLSNAVKYSPRGGAIEVRSSRHDGLVRFAVADEGIGMTPAQQARIFDKFYRADNSDTAVGGLGLGMSIVKLIVESHGGRIWVTSRPGEGTTVFFEIPLV
ncbi:MAG: PAS domain S-box protein [Deltaproteobacteria bacterium]|nr:MAG: PAS domain S-box protein [Deltaproteobacteria bacterium]